MPECVHTVSPYCQPGPDFAYFRSLFVDHARCLLSQCNGCRESCDSGTDDYGFRKCTPHSQVRSPCSTHPIDEREQERTELRTNFGGVPRCVNSPSCRGQSQCGWNAYGLDAAVVLRLAARYNKKDT